MNASCAAHSSTVASITTQRRRRIAARYACRRHRAARTASSSASEFCRTRHRQIDIRQDPRIQQRAVQLAVRIVDRITLAQRVQAIALAGVHLARQRQRVEHAAAGADASVRSRWRLRPAAAVPRPGTPRRRARCGSPVPRHRRTRGSARGHLRKRGLSSSFSSVMPCTAAAPASISRSGFRYSWKCLPVARRLTTSTQPISMMRCPSPGSRPVVSVSSTTCLKRLASRRGCYLKHGIDRGIGERIDVLVAFVAGMALDPAPLTVCGSRAASSARHRSRFFTGLLVGGAPVASLPLRQPLLDAGADVFRIGVQRCMRPVASARAAPRSRPSAPCGCWWSGSRRRRAPCAHRRRSATRPSRRAPGCRDRPRPYRSRLRSSELRHCVSRRDVGHARRARAGARGRSDGAAASCGRRACAP